MTSLSLDGGYLVDGVGYPLHAGYGGQHQHALLAPAHGRGLLLGDLAVPVQVHVVEGGEGAEVAGQLVPGGGVSTKYLEMIFTINPDLGIHRSEECCFHLVTWWARARPPCSWSCRWCRPCRGRRPCSPGWC